MEEITLSLNDPAKLPALPADHWRRLFIEVDLDYLEILYEQHNEFPMESINEVTPELWSRRVVTLHTTECSNSTSKKGFKLSKSIVSSGGTIEMT